VFGEVQFNLSLNKLRSRCVLNQVAISDRIGTAVLSEYEAGAEGYSSLGDQHWCASRQVGSTTVPTTTLDDYAAKMGVDRVDFIKMDIEGAELHALRGAARLLSSRPPPVLLIEFADVNTAGLGYKAIEIWDFLEALGYQFRKIGFSGRCAQVMQRPPDFSQGVNLVALVPEKP
jgi:FkbM family methyltransferase